MPTFQLPLSFDIEPLAELESSSNICDSDVPWVLPQLEIQTDQSAFFKLIDEQPVPLVLNHTYDNLNFAELEEPPTDHAGQGWLLSKQQLVKPEELQLPDGFDQLQNKQKTVSSAARLHDALPFRSMPKPAEATSREPQLLAMCLLMVGRSSAFFRWNERKQAFETVQQMSFQGLSLPQTQGLLRSVVQLGSLFRQLKLTQTTSSVTNAAFKSCVGGCLAMLEEWLPSASIQSPMDLQRACDRMREIVDALWQIHSEIIQVKGHEAVVSSLHGVEVRFRQSPSKLAAFVSAIAAAVYKPWLEQLLDQISTGRDDHSWDQELPELLSASDVSLIRRAKSNTAFLQNFVPACELPPLDVPSTPLTDTAGDEGRSIGDLDEPARTSSSKHAWSPFTGQALHADFQLLPTTNLGPAGLSYLIALHDLLCNEHAGVQTAPVTGPVDIIRSTLMQYAEATSTAVLDHLNKTFDLTTHLGSRYRYFLCGDADFVDQIRSAIFGSDTDGADSLRLNNHDIAWPPRTSRLSLALLSIVGSSTSASFVIRQLPEEEMQRACDPASIHALDFLQLKVETPAALSFLASSEYDQIFAALLLDMRMLHLVTKLRRSKSRVALAISQAYHIVATISSHFVQLVIEETWADFLLAVSRSSYIEEIERAHLWCLQRIRSGLFLRTRQAGVRKAIEEFYTAVLRFGCHLQGGDVNEITTAALQVEQRLRTHMQTSSVKSEGVDIELMKILLGRLAPGSDHDPDSEEVVR